MPEQQDITTRSGDKVSESIDENGPTERAPDIRDTSSALVALERQLSGLKQATDHIQESKEAAENAVEAYRQLHEQSQALVEPVENLIKRIDAVHFPSRFDKLDASVTGLNAALQNVQGQVQKMESAFNKRLDQTEDAILEVTGTLKVVQALAVTIVLLLLGVLGGVVFL